MTPTRSSAIALALAAAALAGCGGGGSKSTTSAKQQAGATTAATTGGATTAPPASTSSGPPGHSTSTQSLPPAASGGNGGTEPAHTVVVLVGRGGKIAPATVNVAPFIAVQVTLRSSDGGSYRLTGKGLSLSAGRGGSSSGRLPGLRTGAAYTLTGTSKVVITASGEPGP